MNASSLLELRPLSIGELLDRTFRLFRQHFLTFFSIVAITQLPGTMFQILAAALVGNPANLETAILSGEVVGPAILIVLSVLFLSGIVTQIGTAALTTAIADSYLGRKINFDSAFRRMDNTWLTLILASFVAGLALFALAIPVVLVSIIPCLGGLAMLVGLFLIGVSAVVVFSLLPPVVVLERGGAIASLKRAWALSKLRFWWIFGYLLLLGILTLLITFGPSFLIGFLIPLVLGNSNALIQSIIQQSATLVLTAVFLPIHFTAVTLMYFDLRIRFEGFDLMVLASNDDEFANDVSDLTTKTIL
ncbi:MAG: hypothetical protein CL608_08935 [Anaerolineaceae bacterium]|nr:hypothetical protein [Anaerolineaceae bacterium]